MDRRTALLTVGALAAAPSAWAVSQTPYGPNQATDFRVLDLANVREIILRLPKGNITVPTEEIWQALTTKRSAEVDVHLDGEHLATVLADTLSRRGL